MDTTKNDNNQPNTGSTNPQPSNTPSVNNPSPSQKDGDSSTPPSLFRSAAENVVNKETATTPETSTAAVTPPTTPTTAAGTQDIFVQFAEKIIKEQEGIIGPIAYEQASKVPGITIDPNTHAINLVGDKKQILENLVKQYELLFGRVSIEICKEAVRGVISNAPADKIPQILL